MSTLYDLIRTARHEGDIRGLLNLGNNQRPSGKTRRGWLKAAKQRRTELLVEEVVSDDTLTKLSSSGSTPDSASVSAQPEPEPKG